MLMFKKVQSALGNEKGQGMVEYGLILALIAVVVVGAMTLMGTGLDTMLKDVTTSI